MSAATLKYTLSQMNTIANNGFDYEMPAAMADIINNLCKRVDAAPLATRVYTRMVPAAAPIMSTTSKPGFGSSNGRLSKPKRNVEASEDEWNRVSEQVVTVDMTINDIRLNLNKLTDKTFLSIREKIIAGIEVVVALNDAAAVDKLANLLYDQCSTNKFYTKVFADLFAELASKYEWLSQLFKQRYTALSDLYKNIRYVDADEDYDGFCEMNKCNEKRRAITTFYVSLVGNGFVKPKHMLPVLATLLKTVLSFMEEEEKRNEVDELTEIISILYHPSILDRHVQQEKYMLNDKTVKEVVKELSAHRVGDYESLSSKSIFKYMDLAAI